MSALHKLAACGRPGHAYLFEGPEGVGKDTMAQAFLARLMCLGTEAGDQDSCGRCRSCAAVQRGDHPDLARLSKDGATIRIDQVRDALGRLRFDPVVGRVKGLIVESAELLREEAANALLKTLEEPPSNTVFVLVTSKPQLLLETIRSRCQVLRFAELSPTDIADLLVADGKTPHDARTAAALAQGSMVLAKSLCDPAKIQVIDFVAIFALALGDGPSSDSAAFIEQLGVRLAETAAGGGSEGDESPEPAARSSARTDLTRDGLQWTLDVIRAVLRDAVLVAGGIEVQTLPHVRHAAAISALVQRADVGQIMAVIDACQRLEERMVLNPNARLALQALLLDAGQRLRGRPGES